MNKCEWVNNIFYPCLNISGFLEIRKDRVGFYDKYGGFYGKGIANFCPFCGADIRKPEPEAPSHEEIMTKWWLFGTCWLKVIGYNKDGSYELWGSWSSSNTNHVMIMYSEKRMKLDFTGRESADIPPEEENE